MTWRVIYARPIARRVIYTHFQPWLLELNDIYDVSSNVCQSLGVGVKKDPVAAATWLGKAAEQGRDNNALPAMSSTRICTLVSRDTLHPMTKHGKSTD